MYVIATAGHVDHGKSTLIQALTGRHPSRLKEELAREMTIDLGFGALTLPGLDQVGIIDVPGHRDFIENMLAGVGGIDAALLVIAADEGIMPQTREHLAILHLLNVTSGIVALTKTDLIDDPDWLALITADIQAALADTTLQSAPIIPVSARTGAGIPELTAALTATLGQRPPPTDRNRPRLPIDRVFTMSGFGTIVTGTLLNGQLTLGTEVEILPTRLRARIRGLQSHNTKRQTATPSHRLAINLIGVEVNQLARGHVVALPNTIPVTTRLDAHFTHLPPNFLPTKHANLSLKHNAEVKLFLGSAEATATARLLNANELQPGQSGWLQLRLHQPIAAEKGDHFILRRPSPAATIGGGTVIDPTPARQHRRHHAPTLTRLQTLAQGSPADIIRQTLTALAITDLATATEKSGLTAEQVASAITELTNSAELIHLEPTAPLTPTSRTLIITAATLNHLTHQMQVALINYHTNHPLRPGLPRESLKSQLNLTHPRAFNALIAHLATHGHLTEAGPHLQLPTFQITFTPAQQQRINTLLTQLAANPYATPLPKDIIAHLNPNGDELLTALITSGQLIQLSPDVIVLTQTYAEMQATLIAAFQQHGQLTVAQVRDLFNTTRKYALALLEYTDQINLTRRIGDARILTLKK